MDNKDMQTAEREMLQPVSDQPVIPETIREQPPNHMATASLVMGIIALVTFCCYYTVLMFGGLSVLFGLLSRPEGEFSGTAKAGMIMGVIAIALMVLFWGVMFTWEVSSIPGIPEAPYGLENVLTVFRQLSAGGGRS